MRIGTTKYTQAIDHPAIQDRKISNSNASNQAPAIQGTEMLPEDVLDISAEGKTTASEFQSKLEELRNRYKTLSAEFKRTGEIVSGAAEGYKAKLRCIMIAMRIMAGDKVPLADHRYLAERDSELYSKALSMRVEKKDPKEYDRLSEDEKNEGVDAVEEPANNETESVEPETVSESEGN